MLWVLVGSASPFSMKTYLEGGKALLMSTHKICFREGASNEYVPITYDFVEVLLMSTYPQHMFSWRCF